jgi:hypothetical protein
VLVRADLTLADQVAQAGHACLEAAWRFPRPPAPCHIVVLHVESERALREALARAEARGVRAEVFWEPDRGLGLTAACSEPVTGSARAAFRRLRLWGAPGARGPPRGRGGDRVTV